MLEHVVKRQVLDQIFRAVDLLVRISKFGLNHKGRRVSGFGCRGVVGAGVSTLRLDVWNVAVLEIV